MTIDCFWRFGNYNTAPLQLTPLLFFTHAQVVRPLQDGDFVRVKMYQMETCQPKVLTLKMDIKYW